MELTGGFHKPPPPGGFREIFKEGGGSSQSAGKKVLAGDPVCYPKMGKKKANIQMAKLQAKKNILR